MKGDHAPVRGNAKLFLAGRFLRITWDSDDMAESTHLCLFVNNEVLRLKPDETMKVDTTGEEIIAPWHSVWQIRVLPQE